jgi:hypothetical protein
MEEESGGRLGTVRERPDLKSQRAIAAKASAEFLERDLTLISEIAEGPLHQKYGVPSHRFQVLFDRQRRTYRCQLVNADHFRGALFNHRRDADAAR